MKIETYAVSDSTIEDFADSHNLVMQVMERDAQSVALSWIGPSRRWYAHFKNTGTKDGPFLRGDSGDGPTPEAAIKSYAREISEKLLVVDAYTGERREIRAPRFKE